MKYINKFKKAFTLIEITIAILIVAILVLLCMPVINNQMKKTEEFAYFTAYKTLEKMAAQILVIGDSVNDQVASVSTPKFISPAYAAFYDDTNGNSLQSYLQKVPASVDAITNFSEYEWKSAAICLGNEGILNKEGTGYLTSAPNCSLYGSSAITNFSKSRFGAGIIQNPSYDLINTPDIIGYGSSMYRYCKKLGEKSGYDSYFISKSDPGSSASECIVFRHDPIANISISSINPSTDTSPNGVAICDNEHGYKGIVSSNGSKCVCSNGVFAANNPKVCCSTPAAGKMAYYDGSACINCYIGAYDEVNKKCCTANSKYSPSLKKCVCDDGYSLSASKCVLSADNCPQGYHLTSGANAHCVQNPPYLRAERFCNAIKNLWNTDSDSCSTFTKVNGTNVYMYTAVYGAVTNNESYMNINAEEGAFNNIAPNIVFSNGMRMWILGDRAASIPGLSYNPDAYNSVADSVCNLRNTNEAGCNNDNNFYCKDESKCYTVSSDENGPSLADARNCCSVTKTDDIILSYQAENYRKDSRIYAVSGFTVFMDIDGAEKGSSTLWEDIFPFYISTDGNVYPGYPLNADDNRLKYIGGNSSYLATDVYYYEDNANSRRKHYVDKGIPLARALCLTKSISVYTPYCQNLGVNFKTNGGVFTTIEKYVNEDYPCNDKKCYIHVKNKIKFF